MLLWIMQAAAQTGDTVTGILKEKASDLPMEFATIVLHETETKNVKNGCMTDSTGQFRFEKVPAGTYYVEGSYVGCTPVRSKVFMLEKGQTIDIGTLYISEGEQLAEVVVEGRKSALVAKLDRKVFNVGQDLMSSAGSASDLMQNIPSVDVDAGINLNYGWTDSVCHDNTVISDSIPFVADNEPGKSSYTTMPSGPYKFKPLQLIVPGTLIGVGIIGLESDWLKFQNREIRDELQENIDHRLTIDDFTQYAPMAATYGLNLCGIKGKHGYGDLTIILGTAYTLMGTTVYAMKNITKVERPDGSARNSFPSGHTATAFMGAELLRREY